MWHCIIPSFFSPCAGSINKKIFFYFRATSFFTSIGNKNHHPHEVWKIKCLIGFWQILIFCALCYFILLCLPKRNFQHKNVYFWLKFSPDALNIRPPQRGRAWCCGNSSNNPNSRGTISRGCALLRLRHQILKPHPIGNKINEHLRLWVVNIESQLNMCTGKRIVH